MQNLVKDCPQIIYNLLFTHTLQRHSETPIELQQNPVLILYPPQYGVATTAVYPFVTGKVNCCCFTPLSSIIRLNKTIYLFTHTLQRYSETTTELQQNPHLIGDYLFNLEEKICLMNDVTLVLDHTFWSLFQVHRALWNVFIPKKDKIIDIRILSLLIHMTGVFKVQGNVWGILLSYYKGSNSRCQETWSLMVLYYLQSRNRSKIMYFSTIRRRKKLSSYCECR